MILLCGVDADGNYAPDFIEREHGYEGLSMANLSFASGSRSSPPLRQGAAPVQPS